MQIAHNVNDQLVTFEG